MKDKILVTICGRAGSKGFKNKNLKSLFDIPLVFYTLSCAKYLKENVLDIEVDICINTDSLELINIAKSYNEKVYFITRPEELCGDTVGKFEVFKHSLKTMEKKLNKKYDYLIDLDLTSPLRKLGDVSNALNTLRANKEAELTITGCRSRRNPYFNMVEQRGNFVEKVINREILSRQQAPQVYDMNASIYVLKSEFVRADKTKMILDAKTVIYEMFDTAVLDIDSEEDFELMQIVAKYLFEKDCDFKNMFETTKKYSNLDK